MSYLQHYKGRQYRSDEVLEVLAFLFGIVTESELKKTIGRRYPHSWKRRALIAACREDGSRSPFGLGYGPDWKGVQKYVYQPLLKGFLPLRGKEQKTCFPVKEMVLEYEVRHRIPLKAMDAVAPVIRRRDEWEWIMHSLDARGIVPEESLMRMVAE